VLSRTEDTLQVVICNLPPLILSSFELAAIRVVKGSRKARSDCHLEITGHREKAPVHSGRQTRPVTAITPGRCGVYHDLGRRQHGLQAANLYNGKDQKV
jgi:hypothetical protein